MEGLECLRRRGGRLGRRGFRRFASRWAVDCGAHWARSGSGVNVLIEGSFGRDLPRIGASTLLDVYKCRALQMRQCMNLLLLLWDI